MILARISSVLALAGLLAAAAYTVRISLADYHMRRGTAESTEAALALLPGQGEYYARLAWLLADQPAKAEAALLHAVQLNGWDSRSWIELALRSEASGDMPTARQYLLRAAHADNRFLPRWSLANYYFRHDDEANFWLWAKASAERVYGDAQPLFRLCGRVREDGQLIDRLGIHDPGVRAQYLSYLMGQNRVDLTGSAARHLLADNRKANVPLLLAACERLLEARQLDLAVEIWNRLAISGSVAFPTPAATAPQLLVNFDFRAPPSSRGFDWRLPRLEGVSISQEESQGLRITFSGREPENCEPLLQLVPVRAGWAYELKFDYLTAGLQVRGGLSWRATDAATGGLLGEGALPPAEAGSQASLVFTAPQCRLMRLALQYRRTPGTTRLDGFVVLRKVLLIPAP
jgi:hypothetical protein